MAPLTDMDNLTVASVNRTGVLDPDVSRTSVGWPTWMTPDPIADEQNATADALEPTTEIPNGTKDPLHGYPYPSLYSWQHIIISSVVVTLIMLVIVLGNMLVIVAVATDRNLKGVQNWFITSLAVSDLLVGLFIMPLSLANELMGFWIFGDVLCELWLAIDVLLCTASILNLCLISLDRYWSVTRAVSYVKTRTRKRAIIMIAIVWIMSMIICLPPLAGWKRPQPTKYGYPLCVLSEEPGYVAYSTIGSFYIPLIVMVLVYFKIYLAARSRARRNLNKNRHKADKKHQQQQQQLQHQHQQQAAQLASQLPDNGRSTSTTSFSNPCRVDVSKPTPAKEPSSAEYDDDQTASTQSGSRVSQSEHHQPETVGTAAAPAAGGQHLLSPDSDERRLLLSGYETCETDSAANMTTGSDVSRQPTRLGDETDSPSDVNSSATERHLVGKDNRKPLLVEESDSLQESDRKSNSHPPNGQKGADQELPLTRLPVAAAAAPNRSEKDASASATKRRPTEQAQHPGSNSRVLLRTPIPQHLLPSPGQIKKHLGGTLVKRSAARDAAPAREDPERLKRKIARAKERRATIVLGIIMATFIICWLPFFSIYLVVSFAHLSFPPMAFAVFFWFGYVNSALNPIIYTIFNRDFKNAFHKIIFGRKNTF